MKTLPIKPILQDQTPATSADLIKAVVTTVDKKGVSNDELRQRMNILTVLPASPTEVVLEDADAQLLKDLTATMRWSVVHKDIVQFIDDVKNF